MILADPPTQGVLAICPLPRLDGLEPRITALGRGDPGRGDPGPGRGDPDRARVESAGTALDRTIRSKRTALVRS